MGARRPLIADVAENAFKAAFKDPRFSPLRHDELGGLALSIAVLTPPSPMHFVDELDLLSQLRPGADGVIIEDGAHRGLFLPAMWRPLPDRQQFLSELKQKAGLRPDYWSPRLTASRFRTAEVKSDPRDALQVLIALAARSPLGSVEMGLVH